jgi:hypothetical protein
MLLVLIGIGIGIGIGTETGLVTVAEFAGQLRVVLVIVKSE